MEYDDRAGILEHVFQHARRGVWIQKYLSCSRFENAEVCSDNVGTVLLDTNTDNLIRPGDIGAESLCDLIGAMVKLTVGELLPGFRHRQCRIVGVLARGPLKNFVEILYPALMGGALPGGRAVAVAKPVGIRVRGRCRMILHPAIAPPGEGAQGQQAGATAYHQ